MTVSGTTPAVCTACTPGPPGEAGPERWSSGTKTSIEWDATPGASWYTLYRGTQGDFAALYSSAVDSCRAFLGSDLTSNGGGVAENPPPGSLFWYLLTASNYHGEGSAGSGTPGPRIVNSSGDCP